MTHPATFWAKYYLSKREYTYEQIERMLDYYNLPGMDAESLGAIERELDFPRLFRPRDHSDRTSQRFLRKEQIYDAWHRGSDMKLALSILDDEALRQLVETLVLSPVKAEQAVRRISKSLQVEITVSAYELFQHYFWKRSLLTSLEWGRFIQDRGSANQEWLQLAIDARGADGVNLLMWKTGLGGLRKVEANRGFTGARDAAFMFLQQIMMQPPSKYHADMYLTYLKAAKLAQEGINENDSAVEDIVQAFNSFRLRTEAPPSISVKQLTGGNFSPAEVASEGEEEMKY